MRGKKEKGLFDHACETNADPAPGPGHGLLLSACGGGSGEGTSSPGLDLEAASWAEIVEAARGTTVTFYGWGGDENRNNWLNSAVADYVSERYDITLEVVGMNIEDILAKLAGEKEAGTEAGSIDMIWINGENFYSAKENGLLYGPFTDKLPNVDSYIDTEDPETLNDFSMPIEGYEAPYAKAQLVLYNDSAVTPEAPASAQALLDYCRQYPGRVTYPAPPDFTGSAFVRNIIYEVCGWEQFQDMEADYDTVKAAIEPALEYLRELNPLSVERGPDLPGFLHHRGLHVRRRGAGDVHELRPLHRGHRHRPGPPQRHHPNLCV